MQFEQLNKSHLPALFDFEKRNRNWFERYVPARPSAYQNFDSFQKATKELLISQSKGYDSFYIVHEKGIIIGRANLVDINEKQAEVGYRVCQSVEGKGVATFAVSKLIEIAFQQLNLNKLVATTTDNNLASMRVLEKLGFVLKRIEKEACVLNNQCLNFVNYELQK